MIFRILSIGTRMPSWVEEAVRIYAKRFLSPFQLVLQEIPAEKRTKNSNSVRVMEKESDALLGMIPDRNFVIVLDVKGKSFSTEAFADYIKKCEGNFSSIDFLIGGPDGLSKKCLARADFLWSLSPLTLPHMLVRVVLAEQLYRAVTILKKHPYHIKYQ